MLEYVGVIIVTVVDFAASTTSKNPPPSMSSTSASVSATTRQYHFIAIIMDSISSNTVLPNATAHLFTLRCTFAFKIVHFGTFEWLYLQVVKQVILLGLIIMSYIHRGPLKGCHFYFYDNFGKCGPISIILSLLDS